MNLWEIVEFSKVPGGAGCAACNAIFDPDLEQGGAARGVAWRILTRPGRHDVVDDGGPRPKIAIHASGRGSTARWTAL